jgi:hypothetical protein
MSIYIDLSSEKLNPRSVARFTRDLANSGTHEDILVKVSKRAHQLACLRPRSQGVPVSKQELHRLNRFLKRSLKANDFVMRKAVKCRRCGRILTFYDLFETGRKLHGDKHMTLYLAAGGYHVHIQKSGQKFPINCTACGALNIVARLGYDGPDY